MDLLTVLLVVLSCVVLYYSQRLLELWRFLKKAKQLPTKDPLPVLGHALWFAVPHNRIIERIVELVRISPTLPTIWLGPMPLLVVYHPQHVEVILGSSKHIDKMFQYKFMEPWLGTGLLTSKGTKWHTHRKMITPTFHFKILEHFIEVFAEKSQILVQKLEKEVSSESFDVFPYISMCALDIICETAMGVKINAQGQEEVSDYVSHLLKASDTIFHRILLPWYFTEFPFCVTPAGRQFKKSTKILHQFTNEVIQERKQSYKLSKELKTDENDLGVKKKLTFLDLLLENSQDGYQLTDEEIREEVDTFMFEGHDTTSAAIVWALQMMGLHPDVQEKVYQEMESIFQGSDRIATMKDLNEMKYLERVIKETLRLFPSVPYIGRQINEDLVIDGLTIPAGMNVAVAVYNTHRIEKYFPNPDTFNPDNFLPERIVDRHPYCYVPFSAGPRNCIGQKFALLEEKVVLSNFVRHYKFKATRETPVGVPELILRPDNGIHLKIIPRHEKN